MSAEDAVSAALWVLSSLVTLAAVVGIVDELFHGRKRRREHEEWQRTLDPDATQPMQSVEEP